jgi:hypothetical protein
MALGAGRGGGSPRPGRLSNAPPLACLVGQRNPLLGPPHNGPTDRRSLKTRRLSALILWSKYHQLRKPGPIEAVSSLLQNCRMKDLQIVVREMRAADARAFLEVHHAAVRGIAVADYPLTVIEAWAPLPVTEKAAEQVRANRENEYRLVAEIDGQVVGIGALVFESSELRACYVAPAAGRRGSDRRSTRL